MVDILRNVIVDVDELEEVNISCMKIRQIMEGFKLDWTYIQLLDLCLQDNDHKSNFYTA